jgi:hypothetical protein
MMAFDRFPDRATRARIAGKSGLAQPQLLDGKDLEARVTTKASQQALEKIIAESAALAAYQIAEVYAWRRYPLRLGVH